MRRGSRATRRVRPPRAAVGAVALLTGVAAAPSAVASADTAGEATADVAHVKLVATNDLHGAIAPPDGPGRGEPDVGGMAYLSSHLAAIRAAHPAVLHVDTGDLAGATPRSSRRFADDPAIEAMNLVGLDVQAIGNHELDRGWQELLRRRDGGCYRDDCGYRGGTDFAGADFAQLAANVRREDTGEPLSDPTHLVDVDGVTVGFVGVTATGRHAIPGRNRRGLDFSRWWEALDPAIAELRGAGADVVVVLRHVGAWRPGGGPDGCDDHGWSRRALEELEHPPDVVVDGHTHHTYVCDHDGRPLISQAGIAGTRFTEIDLHVDRASGEVLDRGARTRTVTHDVAPDPEIEALLARYEELPGLAPPRPSLERILDRSLWDLADATGELFERARW